ncbi:DUF4133 domain-containing protein [Olivibacter sp. 47]|uniref:DUF4133 domain-containing protein n=1 Tax=Olivibacter sp. 47 TaxID=3056486 RepID=UPI0025A47DCB|nr:DUF4133 domain-containing protein [Olivibacter sp. 47]MDM8172947.1 DUF4133 domain-containing protein [Olivibacter sp. 47]
MSSIYSINKGVSQPIVFKGLKAQYIIYLAIGLVVLLILFALLYIIGAGLLIVLPLILMLGTAHFLLVLHLSHRFGTHGLMKYLAKRRLPHTIRFRSRRLFTSLNAHTHSVNPK